MYRNILLPIDLHEESSWRMALPTAIQYCRSAEPRLHVLNVVPNLAIGVSACLPEDAGAKMTESASAALAAFAEENLPGTIDAHCVVGQGPVYQAILEVAKTVDADLIIMAAQSWPRTGRR